MLSEWIIDSAMNSQLSWLIEILQLLFCPTEILRALGEVQPSVLLVYLPESQQHLDLIIAFADFLKNSCHLCPCLVDRDVGLKVRETTLGHGYTC